MKPLNKSYLEQIGIVAIDQGVGGGWTVTRRTRTRSGGIQTSQINPRNNNGSLSLIIGVNGKAVALSLARVLWVWFFGDLKATDDVCLKEPNNYSLYNLTKTDTKTAFSLRRSDHRPSDAAQVSEDAKMPRP